MSDPVRTPPLDAKPRSDRPDPVIEAYKADVDRTLLRESLKKTPEQRIENLQRLHDFATELRRGSRKHRSLPPLDEEPGQAQYNPENSRPNDREGRP